LRAHHQDHDDQRQREHLGHRAGMKNSLIDCVWAMPKAETTVPSRLAAPPKVTTRKASTM
jgi:hypothetical protein